MVLKDLKAKESNLISLANIHSGENTENGSSLGPRRYSKSPRAPRRHNKTLAVEDFRVREQHHTSLKYREDKNEREEKDMETLAKIKTTTMEKAASLRTNATTDTMKVALNNIKATGNNLKNKATEDTMEAFTNLKTTTNNFKTKAAIDTMSVFTNLKTTTNNIGMDTMDVLSKIKSNTKERTAQLKAQATMDSMETLGKLKETTNLQRLKATTNSLAKLRSIKASLAVEDSKPTTLEEEADEQDKHEQDTTDTPEMANMEDMMEAMEEKEEYEEAGGEVATEQLPEGSSAPPVYTVRRSEVVRGATWGWTRTGYNTELGVEVARVERGEYRVSTNPRGQQVHTTRTMGDFQHLYNILLSR